MIFAQILLKVRETLLCWFCLKISVTVMLKEIILLSRLPHPELIAKKQHIYFKLNSFLFLGTVFFFNISLQFLTNQFPGGGDAL